MTELVGFNPNDALVDRQGVAETVKVEISAYNTAGYYKTSSNKNHDN